MAANAMPDAVVIAREMQNLQQSTANLSAEFGRIGNLPAFNGIQALQQQITALSLAIQNGFQGTTQQHTALFARLQLMDVKVAARDENAIARVHNGYLRQPTDALLPLVNVDDGTPINVFPASPGAIDGMSNADVQTVLAAIGVPGAVTNNNRRAKNKQLRIRIGINPNPQYY